MQKVPIRVTRGAFCLQKGSEEVRTQTFKKLKEQLRRQECHRVCELFLLLSA